MPISISCPAFTLALSYAILAIPAGFSHDCAAISRRKPTAEGPDPPNDHQAPFRPPDVPRSDPHIMPAFAKRVVP